ncbi:hypothetical protein FRC06_005394 [Ceratobasidium sp. 370]|nr:hypothetical protein FRC06_005394 [Ceratobasidium sp. 370]
MEEVEEEDPDDRRKTSPPQRNPNAILEETVLGNENAIAYSPPRPPSVTMEEIDEEDLVDECDLMEMKTKTGSPQRNPNAILEEVADEDIVRAPSPRRFPSVAIEEVEDDDMPRVPCWGPHPFAQPTRRSLFPEPHPDPTAGAALRFYDVDREAPPKYTSILADPEVYQEAYWLDNLPISRVDEAEYFNLPRTQRWYWKDLKEFEQEVNRLPRGPSWYRETILVMGDGGEEVLDLWKRNVVEMIRCLLSDPRFIPHTRFAPERHYDSQARDNRVYAKCGQLNGGGKCR